MSENEELPCRIFPSLKNQERLRIFGTFGRAINCFTRIGHSIVDGCGWNDRSFLLPGRCRAIIWNCAVKLFVPRRLDIHPAADDKSQKGVNHR